MIAPEPVRATAADHGAREATPRVTVAIPTWNRAHLVGRALASARAQTVRDIEILVVDDGSTDETPALLAGIDDARLRVVRLERNGGVSRARNTAIERARGGWLAFLDDDNEWAPDYLARQLACAARHPEADVVYCRAWRRAGRGGHEGIIPEVMREGRVFPYLLRRWVPLMSCALVRRSALRRIGGADEALRALEDWDLWLRLAQRTEFAGIPDILVVRHMHPGAHLSLNYAFLSRDAAILDAKWKATVRSCGGWVAYRRWRALLFAGAELVRARRAAEDGQRREGLRSVGSMARHLPWSATFMVGGLALSLLGPEAYRGLAGFWTRVRTSLGRLGAARDRRRGRPAGEPAPREPICG